MDECFADRDFLVVRLSSLKLTALMQSVYGQTLNTGKFHEVTLDWVFFIHFEFECSNFLEKQTPRKLYYSQGCKSERKIDSLV